LATCLALFIALAILNPHIGNSVYRNRTKITERNQESKKWLSIEKDDSTYKKDLAKIIQLINWVLENMNNPDTRICDLMESKINDEFILGINRTHLNFIFYFPEISSFIIEKSINGDFKNAIIFLLNLDLQI
jgi:hypothetical protein